MKARGAYRFKNARYVFADMLDTYLRFSRLPQKELTARVNQEVVHKGTTKSNPSRVTEWLKGNECPSDEVVNALSHILGDDEEDLLAAAEITRAVLPKIRGLEKRKQPIREIADPADWQLDLCQRHLKAKLKDPAWAVLLSSLLLTLPPRLRSFVAVEQCSFGGYKWAESCDMSTKRPVGIIKVYSSSSPHTVQHLALNLRFQYGGTIIHQDEFPGFEYSVAVEGDGVFLVGLDDVPHRLTAYPVHTGSCVGYGAKRPHAVVATDPKLGLKLCHYCFPFRADDHSDVEQVTPLRRFDLMSGKGLEVFGKKSIIRRALETLRAAMEAGRVEPTENALTRIFANLRDVTVPQPDLNPAT